MSVGPSYSRRLAVTLGVLMAAACAVPGATTAGASPATSPGPTTSPTTLTTGYTLSGYDVATSSSGTAYIGWIANTSKSNGATRAVHLCEVEPGTNSCSGGVQVERRARRLLRRGIARAGAHLGQGRSRVVL